MAWSATSDFDRRGGDILSTDFATAISSVRFTVSLTPSFSSASIDAPGYRTAAVERGDIVANVQAAGTLNALVMVDLGSQISGQVKELFADFNFISQ